MSCSHEQHTTPGPWSYYLDPEGYYGISHASEEHDPGDVAHVYVPGSVDPEYDDRNEGLANARLIATAPMLLAALALHVGSHGHTAGCTQIANGDRWPCSTRCRLTRDALSAARPPEAGHPGERP